MSGNPTVDPQVLFEAMHEKRHGMKQAAYELGMSPSALYGYTYGATPSLRAACKLADYCGCGLDDLVRWPR